MNHEKSLAAKIIDHIFGRKYYANVIYTRGIDRIELTSFIFTTRQQAAQHADSLQATRLYRHLETISFRSRRINLNHNTQPIH